ncbi:MAG: RnfABCDGE type electron transport complex subunit B [Spirochaetia bacterium]|nr:RnfABCDGE type electron transport complex subunit B [Spirochaetia bacterium]
MLDSFFPSIPAVLTLAGIGVFFGLLLSAAKIKLHVEKDERIGQIVEALPGANCGACGFPGCAGYAAKIVGENREISLCPVGGSEAMKKIAAIMGIEPSESLVPLKARVHCHGGADVTFERFSYSGPKSCYAAVSVMNGPKVCTFGCLGFGDCAAACLFGAIRVGANGIPVVDEQKCTGCNNCVSACPRSIISLIPEGRDVWVMCKNKEKTSVMRKGCPAGCTGCKLCEKNCPEGAVTVADFCASIDYEKCTACMKCVEACPVPVIHPVEKSKKYHKQKEEQLRPKQEETTPVSAEA